MFEDDYNAVRAKMGRPIPGQSLTNDPENPAPFEKAPEMTNVHEASMYLWDFVTEEETYAALMTAIDNEVPVMHIVQTILFNEFQQGKWNPDLMLMLAEPLAYMLIALAERLDLDIKIDTEEEEGDVFGVEMETASIEKLRESAKESGMLPQGFVTEEMDAKMKQLPEISLLENPEVEEEAVEAPATEQPSLMAQPEGQ
jgi:hypothetical protein|tara:strand:- start:732 stop:1328 length:597 start_codon:yes stop_codon:yes gene_type:complete